MKKIYAHTTTTLEAQATLPVIGTTFVVDDEAREDGVNLGTTLIPYDECANLQNGEYKISAAEWAAYFSGPGYEGRHVRLEIEPT